MRILIVGIIIAVIITGIAFAVYSQDSLELDVEEIEKNTTDTGNKIVIELKEGIGVEAPP